MKILGIDPGLDGGLCFFDVDKGEFQLYPMPIIEVPTRTKIKVSELTQAQKKHRKETGEDFYKTEKEVHSNYIANLMRIEQPTLTILEEASPRVAQNLKAVMTSLKNYGELRALVKLHHLTKDYAVITPQTWINYHGIKINFPKGMSADAKRQARKEKSIEYALKLNPTLNLKRTPRCTKLHDGMAEAFLLAVYGKENYDDLTIF